MTVLPITRPTGLPRPGWLAFPVQLAAVTAASVWPLGAGPALMAGAASGGGYVIARRRYWRS